MIYDYQCHKCGEVITLFRPVAKRDDVVKCFPCKEKAERIISLPVVEQEVYRDKNGERIWFPKDGRPYFDMALRRTFNTAKDKKAYLDSRNLVMDGSSMPSHLPLEAGSVRDRSYRRAMRMED